MEPVTTTTDPSSEVDQALERLLNKMLKWLVTQPEWPLIFNAERHARRQAAAAIAKMLTNIPAFDTSEALPRGLRRKIIRNIRKGGQV